MPATPAAAPPPALMTPADLDALFALLRHLRRHNAGAAPGAELLLELVGPYAEGDAWDARLLVGGYRGPCRADGCGASIAAALTGLLRNHTGEAEDAPGE